MPYFVQNPTVQETARFPVQEKSAHIVIPLEHAHTSFFTQWGELRAECNLHDGETGAQLSSRTQEWFFLFFHLQKYSWSGAESFAVKKAWIFWVEARAIFQKVLARWQVETNCWHLFGTNCIPHHSTFTRRGANKGHNEYMVVSLPKRGKNLALDGPGCWVCTPTRERSSWAKRAKFALAASALGIRSEQTWGWTTFSVWKRLNFFRTHSVFVLRVS